MTTTEDRALGALLGMAVAEGRGVAGRAAAGPGEGTSLALAAARAYQGGAFDPGAAARAMVEWRAGAGTRPRDPFVARALGLLAKGEARPWNAGRRALRRARRRGTAGAMTRAVVAGVARRPASTRLVGEALALTAITNADEPSLLAAARIAGLASRLVHEGRAPEAAAAEARAAAEAIVRAFAPEPGRFLEDDPARAASPSECRVQLEHVRQVLGKAPSFEAGLLAGGPGPARGLLGALLGARFGAAALPAARLAALGDRGALEAAARALLETPPGPEGELPSIPAAARGGRVMSCALPLPARCPKPDVIVSCAGCPVAELTGRAAHSELRPDDAELGAAATTMAALLWTSEAGVADVAHHAAELFVHDDVEGNALGKAVLYITMKRLQLLQGAHAELSDNGRALVRGEPVPRWSDGQLAAGPEYGQLFERLLRKQWMPPW